MVLFNYATKEITAKIVYYGPGLCGKTTNLQFVYDSLPSNNKSKMLSLATKTDRTLFFDFLPLDLGKIRGMRTKLQLYTVPGQVYYNSTRQLVLKGADGIVFVADSQDFALDANLESLQNLEDNLKRQGVRIREIPLVMQYNKRDLPNALPVAEIDEEINKLGVPHFESVATTGIGVEETLKGITQLVLAHLVKKYGLEGSEPIEREIQILNAPVQREQRPPTRCGTRTSPFGVASPSTHARRRRRRRRIASADGADRTPPPPDRPRRLGRRDDRPVRATITTTSATPPSSAAPDLSRPRSRPRCRWRRSRSRCPKASSTRSPTSGRRRPYRPRPTRRGRRATDGLVKEVTVPLNLTLDELRQHRRLRLKITLDVNLLG